VGVSVGELVGASDGISVGSEDDDVGVNVEKVNVSGKSMLDPTLTLPCLDSGKHTTQGRESAKVVDEIAIPLDA
jgi:hypothetical protein